MKKVTFEILSQKLRDLNEWARCYDERYIIVIDKRYMYIYKDTREVIFKSLVPENVFVEMCAMTSCYQRRLARELKRGREHC